MANIFTGLFTRLGWGPAASAQSINPPVNRRQLLRGYTKLEPEKAQHNSSLDYARNTSHNLMLNSAVAKAVLNAFLGGVIGSGVELRSEITRRNKDRKTGEYKLNEAANEEVQNAWKHWGEIASADGTLTWNELTKRVLASIIESGECFVRFIPHNPSSDSDRLPFSLQILEGDMLDEHYSGSIVEGSGEYWQEGIRYNAYGMPLRYAFKVVENGVYVTKEFVAGDGILHLFFKDSLRPNSRRGWPLLTPILGVIDRMEAFMAMALLHSESNAAVNTYLIPDPTMASPLDDNSVTLDEMGEISTKGGGVKVLPAGTRIHERQQIQSAQLRDFVQTSIQQVASAVGLSYEAIALDYSKSNFSSNRMGAVVNQERFREVRDMLVQDLFEPVYKRWLSTYLLTTTSGSVRTADYPRSWHHKSVPYMDPQKQIAAMKGLSDLGVISKTTLAKELGYDYASELKVMEKEPKPQGEHPFKVTTQNDRQNPGPTGGDNLDPRRSNQGSATSGGAEG